MSVCVSQCSSHIFLSIRWRKYLHSRRRWSAPVADRKQYQPRWTHSRLILCNQVSNPTYFVANVFEKRLSISAQNSPDSASKLLSTNAHPRTHSRIRTHRTLIVHLWLSGIDDSVKFHFSPCYSLHILTNKYLWKCSALISSSSTPS